MFRVENNISLYIFTEIFAIKKKKNSSLEIVKHFMKFFTVFLKSKQFLLGIAEQIQLVPGSHA